MSLDEFPEPSLARSPEDSPTILFHVCSPGTFIYDSRTTQSAGRGTRGPMEVISVDRPAGSKLTRSYPDRPARLEQDT